MAVHLLGVQPPTPVSPAVVRRSARLGPSTAEQTLGSTKKRRAVSELDSSSVPRSQLRSHVHPSPATSIPPTPRSIRALKRRKLNGSSLSTTSSSNSPSLSPPARAPKRLEDEFTQASSLSSPSSSSEPRYIIQTRASKRKSVQLDSTSQHLEASGSGSDSSPTPVTSPHGRSSTVRTGKPNKRRGVDVMSTTEENKNGDLRRGKTKTTKRTQPPPPTKTRRRSLRFLVGADKELVDLDATSTPASKPASPPTLAPSPPTIPNPVLAVPLHATAQPHVHSPLSPSGTSSSSSLSGLALNSSGSGQQDSKQKAKQPLLGRVSPPLDAVDVGPQTPTLPSSPEVADGTNRALVVTPAATGTNATNGPASGTLVPRLSISTATTPSTTSAPSPSPRASPTTSPCSSPTGNGTSPIMLPTVPPMLGIGEAPHHQRHQEPYSPFYVDQNQTQSQHQSMSPMNMGMSSLDIGMGFMDFPMPLPSSSGLDGMGVQMPMTMDMSMSVPMDLSNSFAGSGQTSVSDISFSSSPSQMQMPMDLSLSSAPSGAGVGIDISSGLTMSAPVGVNGLSPPARVGMDDMSSGIGMPVAMQMQVPMMGMGMSVPASESELGFGFHPQGFSEGHGQQQPQQVQGFDQQQHPSQQGFEHQQHPFYSTEQAQPGRQFGGFDQHSFDEHSQPQATSSYDATQHHHQQDLNVGFEMASGSGNGSFQSSSLDPYAHPHTHGHSLSSMHQHHHTQSSFGLDMHSSLPHQLHSQHLTPTQRALQTLQSAQSSFQAQQNLAAQTASKMHAAQLVAQQAHKEAMKGALKRERLRGLVVVPLGGGAGGGWGDRAGPGGYGYMWGWERGIWGAVCKARMFEVARRYPPDMIREITESQAREYYAKRGWKYPSARRRARYMREKVRAAALANAEERRKLARGISGRKVVNGNGNPSPAPGEAADGDGSPDATTPVSPCESDTDMTPMHSDDEFMSEKCYPFELMDDDEFEEEIRVRSCASNAGAHASAGRPDGAKNVKTWYPDYMDDWEDEDDWDDDEDDDDEDEDEDWDEEEDVDDEEMEEETVDDKAKEKFGHKEREREVTKKMEREAEVVVKKMMSVVAARRRLMVVTGAGASKTGVDVKTSAEPTPSSGGSTSTTSGSEVMSTESTSGSPSDDEDAEGDIDMSAYADEDPSFNAELSSPTSPDTQVEPVSPGESLSFYVPPMEIYHQSPSPQLQQQGDQQQQDEHQMQADRQDELEASQQHHQHQVVQIPAAPQPQQMVVFQPPILPLPPPRISSIRVNVLRQLDTGAKLIGRGTPASKARCTMWAKGLSPTFGTILDLVDNSVGGAVVVDDDDMTVFGDEFVGDGIADSGSEKAKGKRKAEVVEEVGDEEGERRGAPRLRLQGEDERRDESERSSMAPELSLPGEMDMDRDASALDSTSVQEQQQQIPIPPPGRRRMVDRDGSLHFVPAPPLKSAPMIRPLARRPPLPQSSTSNTSPGAGGQQQQYSWEPIAEAVDALSYQGINPAGFLDGTIQAPSANGIGHGTMGDESIASSASTSTLSFALG